MATMADGGRARAKPITADAYEKVLAVAATALLIVVLVALAKGYSVWTRVPAMIWVHLATVCIALALTPVMLLRPRGDALHRTLGKVWVSAMMLTAAESFLVRFSNDGRFSFIHVISLYVLVAAPLIWWTARAHRVAAHRRHVRGMVTGAIVIAESFTMLPSRMLGQWLVA